MSSDTVAAISTPLGPGGIGSVRISGPEACTILNRLFKRPSKSVSHGKNAESDTPLLTHRVYYGFIINPDGGDIVDEVLAIIMRGPKSFTREDVVEIHSHSGFVVLNRILSAVVDAGARLADPGEFTKRAFLNGRIDLTQAEAIVDLINAPCETAAKIASSQIKGGLRDAVEALTNKIIGLQATVEAIVEFADDAGLDESESLDNIRMALCQSILPQITSLIQRQEDTMVYRQGVSLTIAGMPNVGKSSLLNRLVQKEAAIVSEFPGTTRDIVREYVSIKGVPVVVFDTAGIHDTNDPVECIGIEKAHKQIRVADIILLVVEATRPLNKFEVRLFSQCKAKKTIIVINKDDIAKEKAVATIKSTIDDQPCIRVSARVGSGLEKLKKEIFKGIVVGAGSVEGNWISPNLRQRKLLEIAKRDLLRLIQSLETNPSPDLVSDMINNILKGLSEISGGRNREDLYDHIFSQFCIGK